MDDFPNINKYFELTKDYISHFTLEINGQRIDLDYDIEINHFPNKLKTASIKIYNYEVNQVNTLEIRVLGVVFFRSKNKDIKQCFVEQSEPFKTLSIETQYSYENNTMLKNLNNNMYVKVGSYALIGLKEADKNMCFINLQQSNQLSAEENIEQIKQVYENQIISCYIQDEKIVWLFANSKDNDIADVDIENTNLDTFSSSGDASLFVNETTDNTQVMKASFNMGKDKLSLQVIPFNIEDSIKEQINNLQVSKYLNIIGSNIHIQDFYAIVRQITCLASVSVVFSEVDDQGQEIASFDNKDIQMQNWEMFNINAIHLTPGN